MNLFMRKIKRQRIDKLENKRSRQVKAVEQTTNNIIKEVERLRLEFDINGRKHSP